MTQRLQVIARGNAPCTREDALQIAQQMLYMVGLHGHPELTPVFNPIDWGDKMPPTNFGITYEDGEPVGYVIEAAVAGCSKDNLQVEVDKAERSIGIIHLPTKPAEEEDEKTPKNYTQYVQRGLVERSFRKYYLAPDRSDMDAVSVEYNEGILRVKIPILKNDPNKKVIQVS